MQTRRTCAKPRAPDKGADTLEEEFARSLAGYEGPLVIAVSGGSDSLALMHLLKAYAQRHALPSPIVLSVDHGLRKESARDAGKVLQWAKKAGLKAHNLAWRGRKPRSGIEEKARQARYRLMGEWLHKNAFNALFVGHTLEDQAETFLLRLGRGSGLDGLVAMRATAPWPFAGFADLKIIRPLLSFQRQSLRDYLRRIGQEWIEDPMNEDTSFDRVRIRQCADALNKAGVSAARISAAASHLARARDALEVVTQAVLERAARATERGVLVDPKALAAAPREVSLRALAALLMQVSHQPYRPRFEALERLLDKIIAGSLGRGATLHGCKIAPKGASLLLIEPESPRKTGASGKKPRRMSSSGSPMQREGTYKS